MKHISRTLLAASLVFVGACTANTYDRLRADIVKAQEIVATVNSVAQTLPQCAAPLFPTADAGAGDAGAGDAGAGDASHE